MSDFLALLIKLDGAGGGERSALGGVMVAANIMLFLAVLVTSWFATQQAVDDHRQSFEDVATPKASPANLHRAVATGLNADDGDVVQGVHPMRAGPLSSVSSIDDD